MTSPSGRVIVCAGSGGVGKTTTSAALAMALAVRGMRVAVLTIDPARRLADALSVGQIGNAPCRVPLEREFPELSGSLDAIMLDQKATFDDAIARFAPDEETRRRLLENHYYRFVSSRLAGTHEYMAAEKLFELYTSGRYDVVVLDTPPSRNALEFLEAPERMRDLFDEGVMHWLTLPRDSRGMRILERGSSAMVRVLKRMIGERTMSDIAEFFHIFQGLWGGFRDRSEQVRALMSSPATTFLLVTTPAPAARAEAQAFVEVLARAQMPFAGFLVNRVVPAPSEPLVLDAAGAPAGVDAGDWEALRDDLRRVSDHQMRLAEADARYLEQLRVEAGARALWTLPELTGDISDLGGLRQVAAHLEAPLDQLLG